MRTSAAGLPLVQVYVSGAMIDRLGQASVKGARELGRKGERATVTRQAVTAWFCHTAALSLHELCGTIRGAMRQKRLRPRRCFLHRWTEKTERRLLDLVYDVRPWLLRQVPPIALAHATLAFFSDTPEGRPPGALAQGGRPRTRQARGDQARNYQGVRAEMRTS